VAQRAYWAVADAVTVTGRDLVHWVRQPYVLVFGLLFPVLLVVMFGYLLGGQMELASGGEYMDFLIPGMLALTVVFGIESTMLAVTTDVARGVTDRFRSMPMAPSAVVAGRAGADMLHAAVGLAVMISFGLLVGWRWNEGPLRALAAVGLLLLLRFAVVWLGVYLGLVAKNPQAVAAVQVLVWPLGFLSNAFVAPSTMPGWLGTVSEWNPMSATVSAARELFGNPGWGGESWVAQHSILMAVVWPLVLLAIFAPLSVRRYHRLRR
jgi:ABC transporter DrrB family efflux protein